ncbi:polyunsaturated fatty acid lipoxygenase ALOX12-like [Cebus imitator]|uniref:polyunsaturated fatty acid lipoxygenase ALOX12-like n=1 Tax=Cebus imitator TaxID=2715852 RepID=UPI001898D91D|nr:polyunsaturated fatty acid lipoxygenase ALOX12-like [Cebus imitator]
MAAVAPPIPGLAGSAQAGSLIMARVRCPAVGAPEGREPREAESFTLKWSLREGCPQAGGAPEGPRGRGSHSGNCHQQVPASQRACPGHRSGFPAPSPGLRTVNDHREEKVKEGATFLPAALFPSEPSPRSPALFAPLFQRLRGRAWALEGLAECPLAKPHRVRASAAARPQETKVQVKVPEYLGPLLFVKLCKRHLLQDDAWFCSWIEVRFPCYRWVEGDEVLSPEGRGDEAFLAGRRRDSQKKSLAKPSPLLLGHTVVGDPQGLFRKHQEEELEERRKPNRWGSWKDGLILNVAGAKLCDLPVDERFLEDKRVDFEASLAKGLANLAIKDSLNVLTCWKDLDDFDRIFWCGQSKLAGCVRHFWKEDAFFGYQFLSGANPMLLRHSSSLPAHLVLPAGMEDLKTQLEKELQVLLGFLCPSSIPAAPTTSVTPISLLFASFSSHLQPLLSSPPSYTLLHLHLGCLNFGIISILRHIILCGGALLCIVQCLVAFLASTP